VFSAAGAFVVAAALVVDVYEWRTTPRRRGTEAENHEGPLRGHLTKATKKTHQNVAAPRSTGCVAACAALGSGVRRAPGRLSLVPGPGVAHGGLLRRPPVERSPSVPRGLGVVPSSWSSCSAPQAPSWLNHYA